MNVPAPASTGQRASGVTASGCGRNAFLKHITDPSAEILDLGCGSGLFLNQLRDAGFANAAGVDGRRYGEIDVPVTLLDLSIDQLPYADESFDAVTAWEVLEHLEDPWHAVREARRVLKPGGIFFFSTPNPGHLQSRVHFLLTGELKRWNRRNDHLAVFTGDIVAKTVLKQFSLVEERFCVPTLGKYKYGGRLVRRINPYLSQSKLFGWFALWVVRKK